MKPISKEGIQNARQEGRLLSYLVKRIEAMPTIPEGWLTAEERESARQAAHEESLPLLDREGRFGRSRKGNPTFQIGSYLFWWSSGPNPSSITMKGREFLAWIDQHGINLPDRHLLDPVAAAKKQARDQTLEGQAAKAYWMGVRARAETIKKRRDELLWENPDYYLDRMRDGEELFDGEEKANINSDIATEKQLAFLRRLKYEGVPPCTKHEASTLIDQILQEKRNRG